MGFGTVCMVTQCVRWHLVRNCKNGIRTAIGKIAELAETIAIPIWWPLERAVSVHGFVGRGYDWMAKMANALVIPPFLRDWY